MKRHIVSTLLLLSSIFISTQSPIQNLDTNYNTLPMIHDLEIQQQTSLYRLSIVPITLLVIAYFQHAQMRELMYTNPITTTAVTYFLCNCFIDTWSKYQKIQRTLKDLQFARNMHHYILCIIAIQHRIQEITYQKNTLFNNQEFSQLLKTHTTYNLEELEALTHDVFYRCLLFVQDLCLNPYADKINNQIYATTKQEITVAQIVSLSKNHPQLIAILQKFDQDPEQYLNITMENLGLLIQSELQCFVKQYMYAIPK